MTLDLVTIGVLVFYMLDCIFYWKASYPERARTRWYMVPPGGIIAYLRFGKFDWHHALTAQK